MGTDLHGAALAEGNALGERALDAARRAVRTLRAQGGLFGAAFAASLAVKAFYARASAEELRFVLGPTAALVSHLSGHCFEREAGAGYLSRDLAYLIAPACAGLNYAIAAFWTLVLGMAPCVARPAPPARRTGALLGAAALAYLATLLVNATRIALALSLRGAALPAWLTAAQAHRLLGVAVYLGSLWALSLAVERCVAGRLDARRVVLVPLALYLGVALVAPLLHGADARASFWPHAREVLVASLALAAAALAASAALRRYSPRSRA